MSNCTWKKETAMMDHILINNALKLIRIIIPSPNKLLSTSHILYVKIEQLQMMESVLINRFFL